MRYTEEMSLQFNAEGINGPLVSLSYISSDEDMEVDSIYSVHDTAPQDSDDDDIQVIACNSENREFPPQLAAQLTIKTTSLRSWNESRIFHCHPPGSVEGGRLRRNIVPSGTRRRLY